MGNREALNGDRETSKSDGKALKAEKVSISRSGKRKYDFQQIKLGQYLSGMILVIWGDPLGQM